MRLMMVISLVFVASLAMAEEAAPTSDAKSTIDRGLAFLAKDAIKWKADHNCVSCHHAALIAWSLQEAKLRGHAVDDAVMNEMTKWVAEAGSGKVGVPRPEGRPKAFNTKAVYFALALNSVPTPDESVQKGLKLMLETVKSDQLENGSWVAWPDTRPPLFGGSDDSMSALATLALLPTAATDDAAAKGALDKAVKWFTETKTDGDPQSVALRLLLWTKLGRPTAEWMPLVEDIAKRQNADGGWSQAKDMPSDAWATGQALYALAHAGDVTDTGVIEGGRQFLIKTQRPDGSWPMTSRPSKPGDKGGGPIPITGAGSAWAVLGLVRTH